MREHENVTVRVETLLHLYAKGHILWNIQCPVPYRVYVVYAGRETDVTVSRILGVCCAYNAVYLQVSSPCDVSYSAGYYAFDDGQKLLCAMRETGIVEGDLYYKQGFVRPTSECTPEELTLAVAASSVFPELATL
jgi:hypothetical protein